nr:hypothetical protein [Planctomycetota bacterium]
EWCYDGLGGSIIKWTMDHGSKKADGKPQDHPSLLAIICGRDGNFFSLLSNGQQYQAGSLMKWANEQLDAYEKQFPSTRMPFVPGKVEVDGEGTEAKASSPEIDAARKAKKPLLIYFGRGYFDPKDKKAKKENKLARKFEKGTLNSKTAAKEVEGWVLLRFDLSNADHAKLATQLGVTAAPDLLMWLPADDNPTVLGRKASGGKVAYHLKTFNKAAKAASSGAK